MRAAQPAVGRVSTVLITETTFDNHNFFPTPVPVWLKHFAGGPVHERRAGALMFVQRSHPQIAAARAPLLILRADAHHLGIIGGKLVQFYKDQTALFGTR